MSAFEAAGGGIQDQLHTWRKANFPNADSTQQLLGVQEELGELAHAHLKQIQGIRGTESYHRARKIDAVGDILIFLLGYCSYEEIDMFSALVDTAREVMERDWIRYPKSGHPDFVVPGVPVGPKVPSKGYTRPQNFDDHADR